MAVAEMVKEREKLGIPGEVDFLVGFAEFIELYGDDLTLIDIQEIIVDRIFRLKENGVA